MPASVHSNPERKNVTLAQKRGVAIAALDERPHRPVKRRASKACQCCRSRKVRCNVVEHGAPCTNCRLDQIDCVITESKRKRKSISQSDTERIHFGLDTSFGASPAQEAPWTPPPSGPVFDQSPGGHVPHPLYRSHETTSPAVDQFPRQSISSMDSNESVAADWTIPGSYAAIPPYAIAPYIPPAPPAPIPEFIKPLPARLDPEEVKFLRQKDALSIPDFELCNALLNSYVEFVDPSLPILDLDGFIDIVRQADGALGKVSLLVLQAVMFAGSTFVDLSHLRRAGFVSRHQARRSFYAKARLLYDHDYESDRVAVVQTLLLFTYWYETPDDPKDAWHWMGVATSVAQSIGMNRDPRRSNLDEQRQRLWKRIWWSCVIRDRLIGIGMRRPIRIKEEEHDVPMVTLNDFPPEPQAAETQQSSSVWTDDCSPGAPRSWETRQTLSLIFISHAQLSRCIGNVIHTQYTSPGSSLGQDGRATVSRLLPKHRSADGAATTRQCNDELAVWMSQLPECVRIPSDGAGCPLPATDPASVVLNRCLLHMVHYMTLSALHRPHALRSGSLSAKHDADTGHPSTPEGYLRHAAFRITDLLQHLHHNKLARFLPTTGITVLQPAIINHLLDVKSEHNEVRMEGIRGFCQCFQVLSRLKDVYPGAEYSILIVDAAVKRAGLDEKEWFVGAQGVAGLEAAHGQTQGSAPNTRPDSQTKIETAERLVRAGLRLRAVTPPTENGYFNHHRTPSHSHNHTQHWQFPALAIANQAHVLTPPASESSSSSTSSQAPPKPALRKDATATTTKLDTYITPRSSIDALTPPTSASASGSSTSEDREDGRPGRLLEGEEFLDAEEEEGEDEEGLDGYRRVLRDRELEKDFDRLIDMDLDADSGGEKGGVVDETLDGNIGEEVSSGQGMAAGGMFGVGLDDPEVEVKPVGAGLTGLGISGIVVCDEEQRNIDEGWEMDMSIAA